METLTTARCVICGSDADLVFPGGHVHHPEHSSIKAGFCRAHAESKEAGAYWGRHKTCDWTAGCFGTWLEEMGCTRTVLGSHNSILR
jgi:hypothetical protein